MTHKRFRTERFTHAAHVIRSRISGGAGTRTTAARTYIGRRPEKAVQNRPGRTTQCTRGRLGKTGGTAVQNKTAPGRRYKIAVPACPSGFRTDPAPHRHAAAHSICISSGELCETAVLSCRRSNLRSSTFDLTARQAQATIAITQRINAARMGLTPGLREAIRHIST